MKVTIVRSDNLVMVDGENIGEIDCSALPDFVHAVQWDGDKGWLEPTKGPNIVIVDLSPYQFLVDEWNRLKAEAEAAEQAAAEAEQEEQAGSTPAPIAPRNRALQARRIRK